MTRLLRLDITQEKSLSDSWLPPHATGTPQGLAVDSHGDLYYADLDIVWEEWMPGPGSNGRVWRVRMGPSGEPQAPEVLLEGLSFPDGLGIISRPPSRN